MRGNTISIELCRGRIAYSKGSLFQFDRGQRLLFTGVTLPDIYQVHFSNKELGLSNPMIGDENGVDIPDKYLQSGENIYVWVYYVGEDHAETEYNGVVKVIRRAEPTDIEPTPAQQSVIDQIMGELGMAKKTREDSEAWAVGMRNGEPVTEEDETYQNNSKYWAECAAQSLDNAGIIDMEIDENGNLIYTRTDTVNIDFNIVDGELIMEVV